MSSIAKRRVASTLIETLILLTMSSSILVLAIGWIHQSMRLATTIRDHDRHHQSVMRLSRQFRDDAHQALSVSCDRSHARFKMGDQGIVVYQIEEHQVRRSQRTQPDSAILNQESYLLHTHADVVFEDSELPRWVTLTVLRGDPGNGSPVAAINHDNATERRPIDMNVRAVVGRLRGDRPMERQDADETETGPMKPSESEAERS